MCPKAVDAVSLFRGMFGCWSVTRRDRVRETSERKQNVTWSINCIKSSNPPWVLMTTHRSVDHWTQWLLRGVVMLKSWMYWQAYKTVAPQQHNACNKPTPKSTAINDRYYLVNLHLIGVKAAAATVRAAVRSRHNCVCARAVKGQSIHVVFTENDGGGPAAVSSTCLRLTLLLSTVHLVIMHCSCSMPAGAIWADPCSNFDTCSNLWLLTAAFSREERKYEEKTIFKTKNELFPCWNFKLQFFMVQDLLVACGHKFSQRQVEESIAFTHSKSRNHGLHAPLLVF